MSKNYLAPRSSRIGAQPGKEHELEKTFMKEAKKSDRGQMATAINRAWLERNKACGETRVVLGQLKLSQLEHSKTLNVKAARCSRFSADVQRRINNGGGLQHAARFVEFFFSCRLTVARTFLPILSPPEAGSSSTVDRTHASHFVHASYFRTEKPHAIDNAGSSARPKAGCQVCNNASSSSAAEAARDLHR